MFYNVENLFHPSDDPKVMDSDFTPNGKMGWSFYRYNRKIASLLKVFAIVGEWEMPSLIGLAEIENDKVLKDIIFKKGMKGYSFIHKDSPDIRGIDVALLYKREDFKVLSKRFFRLNFPFNTRIKSRDILYAKGLVMSKDTLHVFVNHWPSRRGGSRASENKRVLAANVLKSKIDSIYQLEHNANILIMGDFNDEPSNKSLQKVLMAEYYKHETPYLINMAIPLSKQGEGTYKYRNKWNMFDQIILSPNMLNSDNKLYTEPNGMKIFRHKIVLEQDKTYIGDKPFRTYRGPIYYRGISDHLSVYLDIYQN